MKRENNTFEESKRVSTTKGFLGYKDKSLSIVEHRKGLLSVWRSRTIKGIINPIEYNHPLTKLELGIK